MWGLLNGSRVAHCYFCESLVKQSQVHFLYYQGDGHFIGHPPVKPTARVLIARPYLELLLYLNQDISLGEAAVFLLLSNYT